MEVFLGAKGGILNSHILNKKDLVEADAKTIYVPSVRCIFISFNNK